MADELSTSFKQAYTDPKIISRLRQCVTQSRFAIISVEKWSDNKVLFD